MTDPQITASDLQTQDKLASGLVDAIRRNARTAIIAGIVMLICGVLAVGSPLAAGLSLTIFVGVLLGVGGISQCVLAFQAGALSQGLLMFLIACLPPAPVFTCLTSRLTGWLPSPCSWPLTSSSPASSN